MSTSRLTLKLATSLDGRIATASGESRWITGPQAREQVHRLRAAHDAVMVGIETALADDPELTVRLADYSGRQPTRVILDSKLRLSASSKLVQTARTTPTLVLTCSPTSHILAGHGVSIIQVGEGERPSPAAVLQALRSQGLSKVFLEGGGQVAASFLGDGLVDAVEWFRAPMVLGQTGRSAIGDLDIAGLAASPRFRRTGLEILGDDAWERYVRV